MDREKTTDKLMNVLRATGPERADRFFEQCAGDLASGNRPFAAYFSALLKKKGLKRQTVFLNADVPEGYGYKILSEEKRTRRRDTILRLCFGAKLTLDETQRALKYYGMSELYARVPRDAVLIIAFNSGIFDVFEVDALLLRHQMPPLRPCHGED